MYLSKLLAFVSLRLKYAQGIKIRFYNFISNATLFVFHHVIFQYIIDVLSSNYLLISCYIIISSSRRDQEGFYNFQLIS